MQVRRILTYGTFDLFHVGHLRLIERAAALGDELIVGVSTNTFNQEKGKETVIPYEDRAAIVAAVRGVSRVIPEESWDQKEADIRKYDIHAFVMGDDWTGRFDGLSHLCEVVYVPRTPHVSTESIVAGIQARASSGAGL